MLTFDLHISNRCIALRCIYISYQVGSQSKLGFGSLTSTNITRALKHTKEIYCVYDVIRLWPLLTFDLHQIQWASCTHQVGYMYQYEAQLWYPSWVMVFTMSVTYTQTCTYTWLHGLLLPSGIKNQKYFSKTIVNSFPQTTRLWKEMYT